MNHIYCAVECKSCKRESKSNWLILKYMGPDDGRKADITWGNLQRLILWDSCEDFHFIPYRQCFGII